MQQNKTVEKFTGHYVFFLGVARFFSCAHWILQMFDSRGTQLWAVRAAATEPFSAKTKLPAGRLRYFAYSAAVVPWWLSHARALVLSELHAYVCRQ